MENYKTRLGKIREKIKNIADIIDILVVISIIYFITKIIFTGIRFDTRILNTSLIAYMIGYLVTSRVLAQKGLGYQRIFHSLAAMVSGIWLFEMFYHYSFLNSNVIEDLIHIDISGKADGTFPLIWSIIMISMVLTGWRDIILNKWFLIISSLAIISFYIWISIGYPQISNPQWWPSSQPTINIIPYSYRYATTLEARQTISYVAMIFNSITKTLTCLIPASLFFGNKKD